MKVLKSIQDSQAFCIQIVFSGPIGLHLSNEGIHFTCQFHDRDQHGLCRFRRGPHKIAMNCNASLRRGSVAVFRRSAKDYDIIWIWTLLDRLGPQNASELILSSKSFDATFVLFYRLARAASGETRPEIANHVSASASDWWIGRGCKPSSARLRDESKCMVRFASLTPVTVAFGALPVK
jgi:hypothetical protein